MLNNQHNILVVRSKSNFKISSILLLICTYTFLITGPSDVLIHSRIKLLNVTDCNSSRCVSNKQMFEMSMCLPTSHSNRDGLTSNNHTNGTKDRHGTCLKTLKKPTRPGGTYLNLHGYAHSEYGQLCGKKRKKHILFFENCKLLKFTNGTWYVHD